MLSICRYIFISLSWYDILHLNSGFSEIPKERILPSPHKIFFCIICLDWICLWTDWTFPNVKIDFFFIILLYISFLFAVSCNEFISTYHCHNRQSCQYGCLVLIRFWQQYIRVSTLRCLFVLSTGSYKTHSN